MYLILYLCSHSCIVCYLVSSWTVRIDIHGKVCYLAIKLIGSVLLFNCYIDKTVLASYLSVNCFLNFLSLSMQTNKRKGSIVVRRISPSCCQVL